jgi:hypothetical protein
MRHSAWMMTYSGVERRSGKDRRRRRFSVLKTISGRGTRRNVRRADDRRKITLLDHYSTSLFIGIMIVLGLSLTDGLLTLMLISQGARELNPIMDYYIKNSPHAFLLVKYGLTASSVLIVLMLDEVLRTRYNFGSKAILNLFSSFFGSVLIWQWYLFTM